MTKKNPQKYQGFADFSKNYRGFAGILVDRYTFKSHFFFRFIDEESLELSGSDIADFRFVHRDDFVDREIGGEPGWQTVFGAVGEQWIKNAGEDEIRFEFIAELI